MHLRKEITSLLNLKVLSFLIIVFIVFPGKSIIHAQSGNLTEIMDTTSIEKQYDYIIEKSSRYEQYKVIRETWLNQYRESLYDTISGLRNTITENKQVINDKDNKIQELNDELANVKDERDLAVKEKNSLKFLGIKLEKTFYNLIMWIVIVALAVMLVLVYLMFKRSNIVTRETKSEITDLQKEYDEYRNNARLKMEKVKRDHLNEIQKIKGGR